MTGDAGAISAGARRGRSRGIWRGLSDSFGFIGTAIRLLGRHGPVLFALAFGGVAVQWGVMALAKQGAKLHPLAGLLTVMFVPLVVLSTYVLMMRAVRGSLPFARAAGASVGVRRSALDHLGSVLLPFLAVWAAQGFLDDVVEGYRHAVWRDVIGENLSHLGDDVVPEPITAGERLNVTLSVAVVVVVVVAFTARWAIGRFRQSEDPFQPPRGPRWLGVLGAYFESVWLMLVFVPLAAVPAAVMGWTGDRRIVAWAVGLKDDAVGRLGSFSAPADGTLSWIGEMFGNAQTVILAPVAWLTVGAVIYGHRLPDLTGESDDHRDRHATGTRFGRWASAKARSQFTGRFGPLVGALRLLARGSTRPLLLFCLLFLVISPLLLGGRRLLGLEGWLWDLERLIAGPHDRDFWFLLSYTLGPINQAIQDVLLICLLTAAVDRLVLAQRLDRDLRATPPSPTSSAATAAPAPADPPLVPALVGVAQPAHFAPYAVSLNPTTPPSTGPYAPQPPPPGTMPPQPAPGPYAPYPQPPAHQARPPYPMPPQVPAPPPFQPQVTGAVPVPPQPWYQQPHPPYPSPPPTGILPSPPHHGAYPPPVPAHLRPPVAPVPQPATHQPPTAPPTAPQPVTYQPPAAPPSSAAPPPVVGGEAGPVWPGAAGGSGVDDMATAEQAAPWAVPGQRQAEDDEATRETPRDTFVRPEPGI